jgi:hypothetical protein
MNTKETQPTVAAEYYIEHLDREICWNPLCACRKNAKKMVTLSQAFRDGLLTEAEKLNIEHGHTV